MKPVIAYVDDDLANLTLYQQLLSEHFTVEIFPRSQDLARVIPEKSFDCFILDVFMPELDGFQLLEKIRSRPENSSIPVFFVTARPQDEIKINSYKKGATDFFDRLTNPEELIARLESRIRAYKESRVSLSLGSLRLDLNLIDCYLEEKKLVLTMLEFKILAKILRAHPYKVTKADLIQNIWGNDAVNANNLNTHLYNLRLKLADWDYEIDNHRFMGFGLKKKI